MQTAIKEKVNYRPNSCKSVYKYDSKGELAHSYTSMTEAVKGEHIAYGKLKEFIASGDLFRNHSFSLFLKGEITIPFKTKALPLQDEVREPWESENGMFNIRGWGKVCF